jgi:chaperone modulatory protein CbpM
MNNSDKKHVLLHCEEIVSLSLNEVCVCFDVSEKVIESIVDEGIVSPLQELGGKWQFDDQAIRLIRIVLNLDRDLGVNLAGAGLVVELLDEIQRLRHQLNHLE